MKHRVAGRKLGRTSAHRLALLRNLSTALFDKEKITTTLAKAKELRPFAEKLVTLSKRETLHARRRVLRHIHDRRVVGKLFDVLSARYAQRAGGYTRILKLGPRRGDSAELAVIELVGAEAVAAAPSEEGGSKKKKAAPAETARASGVAKGSAKPSRGKAKPAAKKAPEKKAASKKKAAAETDAAETNDEKPDKRAKSKSKPRTQAKPKGAK